MAVWDRVVHCNDGHEAYTPHGVDGYAWHTCRARLNFGLAALRQEFRVIGLERQLAAGTWRWSWFYRCGKMLLVFAGSMAWQRLHLVEMDTVARMCSSVATPQA